MLATFDAYEFHALNPQRVEHVGLESRLARDVFRRTRGFIVNWPLGRELRVGDLVQIPRSGGRTLKFRGTLARLGISIGVDRDESVDDRAWKSSYRMSVAANSCGTVNRGDGRATLDLTFQQPRSYLFEPSGMSYDRITDLPGVERGIKHEAACGQWGARMAVVTEIARASSYALLISASHGARVRLAAEGRPMLTISDLAETLLRPSISVDHAGDLELGLIGSVGGPVAFRAHTLKLRDPKKRALNLHDVSELEAMEFVPPGTLLEDDTDLAPLRFEDLDGVLWGDED